MSSWHHLSQSFAGNQQSLQHLKQADKIHVLGYAYDFLNPFSKKHLCLV